MPIIKALLFFGGAVTALAKRGLVWLDDVATENFTSDLEVTSTCCNSDGTILFQPVNDLWCLSYNCITMHGGAGAFGGFLNPANWAEEKDQCHRIGYVTWGELKAGRPDIQTFEYKDLYADPAYFEYLLKKYIMMGVMPLCGPYTVGSAAAPTDFNSRPATGPEDDLYKALIAKIVANRPPETPADAKPTDMGSQDKGWKLPNPSGDTSPGKRDTKNALYEFEDALEEFVKATKPPGSGRGSLAQGQQNQRTAFFALFEGAFEGGGKALEAIGGAAETVFGVPGAILGKAKRMWLAYEEYRKERRMEKLREWAAEEWRQMQDEWDRQMQEEFRVKSEAHARQRALEDREEARVRAAKKLGFELKILEDLVDRGLPDPPIKPVDDADLPLMKKVYEKLDGRHGRMKYFRDQVNQRSQAAGMSGPELSFHAASLRCAREWLECDLRQEGLACKGDAERWLRATHGAGAASRCRHLHGEVRLLLGPERRGTKKFPSSYRSVPLPDMHISVKGLPRRSDQFTPEAQDYIMTTYRFLREQWRGPRFQICGDKKYDYTFCQAGEAVLDSILPP